MALLTGQRYCTANAIIVPELLLFVEAYFTIGGVGRSEDRIACIDVIGMS